MIATDSDIERCSLVLMFLTWTRSEDMKPTVRETWSRGIVWSAQILLTMFFIGAGYAKLTAPIDHLGILLGWTAGAPSYLLRVFGLVEICLGVATSLNLVFDAPASRLPIRSALVGGAMAMTMAIVHLFRLEAGMVLINVVLFLSCWVVRRGSPTS